jgi:hypothetical protein
MNKRIMTARIATAIVSLQIVARSACMQCNQLTIFQPQPFSNVTIINESSSLLNPRIPAQEIEAVPAHHEGDFFSIFDSDEADRLELIPRKSSLMVRSAMLFVLFLTITGALFARIAPAAR